MWQFFTQNEVYTFYCQPSKFEEKNVMNVKLKVDEKCFKNEAGAQKKEV